MKGTNIKLTKPVAIALLIATSAVVPVQPASAQILELATGALSILNTVTGGNKPQQAPPQQVAPPQIVRPQSAPPSPKFTVGAGNLNGNKINLCMTGCMPGGSPVPAPVAVPQPTPIAR